MQIVKYTVEVVVPDEYELKHSHTQILECAVVERYPEATQVKANCLKITKVNASE